MPIIFEDYRKRRRNRRIAVGAGLIVAATAGGLVESAIATKPTLAVKDRQVVEPVEAAALHSPTRDQAVLSSMPEQTSATGSDSVSCSVVDGDTLRCDGERVRLLGIDAPELPGHCRPGRQCVQGDPFAASEALEQALGTRKVRIARVGTDHYGRTLANIYVGEQNVGCRLLAEHTVAYIEKWDNDGLLARDCPELAH